jgi:hypothetical protein
MFGFLIFLFIVLFFATAFAGKLLPFAGFISLIIVSIFIAFWYSCYVFFQVWLRSALYLDSFDDSHDPSAPWDMKVKRLLYKQKRKAPIQFLLFRTFLGIHQLSLYLQSLPPGKTKPTPMADLRDLPPR